MNPGDFNIRLTMEDIDIDLRRVDTVVWIESGGNVRDSFDLAEPKKRAAFEAWLQTAIGEQLEFECETTDPRNSRGTADALIEQTVATVLRLMTQVRWGEALAKAKNFASLRPLPVPRP